MNGSSTPPDSSTKHPTHVRDLDRDYADERHIRAFAEALNTDEFVEISETPTPGSPHVGAFATPGRRVRKVSALSDFAPVNQRVTSLYILIRQLVNTKEWLIAWRGRKGLLRKRLRSARTYQEWKDAAQTLDEYLKFDAWKTIDEDPFYDWKLVRKVLRTLRSMRAKNDVYGVLGVLETCIRTNFAGTESPRLYSETFYGTKDLIEAYVAEQEIALEFIRDSPDLSNEEKKRFFKNINTNLGASALCLSGGATFGYYHFGVVKAFLDADLLPRVISGTSAGGLVAALVCTRTDEELKELLVPELANRITACEETFNIWFKRFWDTGARFDSVAWARKATFFTRGSMTFKEAYLRTGRILNVSVIPADRHSPTKLLNYLTAPDTVIWSALLASAAVPGILNPVVLMQKLKDGSVIPWNWGSKFKDGSLRVDIPVQSLNLYFNVTHPIVSQVNPHVHLFFFAPRGSAGKPVATRKSKGWRGNFLLSAAEQWLKLELTKNFKVIRDLDLLPPILGQDWSSVFLQRFDGTVTIWPRTRFMDWIRILSDPDVPELDRMMRVGQLVTWPKLHMIENRYRLEKQIYQGRQAVRRAMRSKSQARAEAEAVAAPQGRIPTPITLVAPALALNLSGSGSGETPVPVDSDAEQTYAQSASRPQHQHKRQYSKSSRSSLAQTSGSSLRSPRRRWSSMNLRQEVDSDDDIPAIDFGRASPDPPPDREGEGSEPPPVQTPLIHSPRVPASPSALFQRLRTASLSPFATIRRSGFFGKDAALAVPQDQQSVRLVSSESSSTDDDLSIASKHVWHALGDSQSDGSTVSQNTDIPSQDI
ncbi:hypothetical protein EIP86_010355 [Pleurotus ostreatoroseus]|nr:hypothetical protein EIP86_010355 [Pleurotus ostreatoroseus]